MRLRPLIRTAVIVSVILLCTGIGVYSFFRLDAAEHRQDFNLYTLVPEDAVAVLETDRMAGLVEEINQLSCSRNQQYLYVSELFAYLKKYLRALVDDTPHGLSRQMDKMLISFHEPDTPMNQVLYCSLGDGDHDRVETFVRKYSSSDLPSKQFAYKGETIHIYPMNDGRFLAAYFTRDFLAVSFQKRLIEQVIDALREKRSLMQQSSFHGLTSNSQRRMAAALYVRVRSVEMGKPTDGLHPQASVGNWLEFDMKFDENKIYCSGIGCGNDSARTFVNALRCQHPLEGFAGKVLPATTFFHHRWALSDREAIFNFTARQEYAKTAHSDYVKQRDCEWFSFLNDHADESLVFCLFHPGGDTLRTQPCAVLRIPLVDAAAAERDLHSLLYITPPERGTQPTKQLSPRYSLYPKARPFRQYLLPRTTLFAQLTGITGAALRPYACFYRDVLLLAPDAVSLSAYIDALEGGAVLEGDPLYEEEVAALSPSYNFLMMMDMGEMMRQPEDYVRLVPNFFFRHANFFRHFVFATEFTYVDGMIYPNVVLQYKDSIAVEAVPLQQ